MTDTEHPTEVEPADEPGSASAGAEDHENVDMFRGDEADAPEDTGKPEEGSA